MSTQSCNQRVLVRTHCLAQDLIINLAKDKYNVLGSVSEFVFLNSGNNSNTLIRSYLRSELSGIDSDIYFFLLLTEGACYDHVAEVGVLVKNLPR